MFQSWRRNPWLQKAADIERKYGFELGDEEQQCMEHPIPLECGICGNIAGWWKPSVGSFVCTCGAVRKRDGSDTWVAVR